MSITEQITELKQDFDDVYEAGIAEGEEQENLELWNMMTNNGKKGFYTYAFRYWDWKVANPPVLIKPTGQFHTMMSECPNLETIVPDNFDFSATPDNQTAGTAAYYHTFSANPKLKAIPDMNMPPRGMYYTFYNCTSLERIERVQIRENTQVDGAFARLPSLKYIRFDGTIGTTMNLNASIVLDRGSIENIIGCLSSNVSGKTLHLHINAVNKAFETSGGANNGSTSTEWQALVASKPHWTITLENT